MKFVISLFLIIFSSVGLACSDVNFYESHPLINSMPIQNQGTLNTCYAQALSTVYNLEFDQKVDPFWIAFVHKIDGLHWQPHRLDYSMMSLAWNDLKKSGSCSSDLVEVEYEKLKNGVSYSDSQLFYLLTQYFNIKSIYTLDSTVDRLVAELPHKTQDDFELNWKKEDLLKILSPIHEESYRLSLFDWMDKRVFKSCKENKTHAFNEQLISTARTNESNDLLAALTEGLLNEQRSVSIGFCWRVFKNPKAVIHASPRILKAINNKCGAHYVTLVGSRKKADSCEYLVRNSFGTGFWASKDYSCYCKDKSTNQNRNCEKSESSNPDLEVLGCWMDRDTLLTNTFDLSYFQKN